MKIIIGLGNPGKQYKNTWHNLGFESLDNTKELFSCPDFKTDKKLEADISTGQFNNEKIILAKPQTFMNESGRSVSKIIQYYKADTADIIVIHDDVDLPTGKIKISLDSSAGGHNGVKSIITYLKTKKIWRIRIGAKTKKFPKIDTADYVLGKINLLQKSTIKQAIKKSTQAVEEIITKSPQEAMNKFN